MLLRNIKQIINVISYVISEIMGMIRNNLNIIHIMKDIKERKETAQRTPYDKIIKVNLNF